MTKIRNHRLKTEINPYAHVLKLQAQVEKLARELIEAVDPDAALDVAHLVDDEIGDALRTDEIRLEDAVSQLEAWLEHIADDDGFEEPGHGYIEGVSGIGFGGHRDRHESLTAAERNQGRSW